MNGEPNPVRSGLAYCVAVLGALLIVAGLVFAMRHYTQPAPLGEERAAFRAQNLVELRAAEAEALQHAGWVDQTKGLVRLPKDVAMNLWLSKWQANPAKARADLIERVEKATAPPPKVPEKPSAFE